MTREAGDVGQLSSLGHFLKGSSATLGLVKVRDSCEKIQHWGSLKESGAEDAAEISPNIALRNIGAILPTVKADCSDAENRLKAFYPGDHNAGK